MKKTIPIYQLEPKNKTTIFLGLFSVLSLWIGLYIFGYYFNYKDHNFIPKNATESERKDPNGKDYTISCSLSGGNKIGITIAFILGVILFLPLIFLRFKEHLITKIFLSSSILILLGFLISMIYYNPYDDGVSADGVHTASAFIAFILSIIINLTIITLLIKSNRKYLIPLVVLAIIEVLFLFSFIGVSIYLLNDLGTLFANPVEKKEFGEFIAVSENILFNFLIISILLLSFL